MSDRNRVESNVRGAGAMRVAVILFAVGLLALAGAAPARAGTTGKLAGLVRDAAGAAVPAAVVRIEGTSLDGVTDGAGHFTILNIPPGAYEVTVAPPGFDSLRMRDVVVSSDQTTRVNFDLTATNAPTEEIVVTAKRSPVSLNLTNTQAALMRSEIEQLPVQDLDDLVNLQAGVVEGHFRGGRLGEVQYQVDGVSVNNAFDNKSSLSLDRSLLQEVQVISGTFDAEYGQAMSGVVNAVLRQGTETFEWGAEVLTGDFVFGDGSGRLTGDEFDPGATRNFQANGSGPLPLPDTVFLVSGRRYEFDDYVQATREFVPEDRADFETKVFDGSGDGETVPLGYSREWSGVAKITNTSMDGLKLNYQALMNRIEARRTDFAFRLNPDGLSTQETFSISHGLDANYEINSSTFLDLTIRQNYFDYKDFRFEDVFDPGYDEAGPATGDSQYELGAMVQGVEFTRFRQTTDDYVFKAAVASQVTSGHHGKVGGEFHVTGVEFGTPGTLSYATQDGVETLIRHVDEPPDFPGLRTYRPRIAAMFAQDQMEWQELTVRAGVRADYFHARSTIPSDLANPANAISGAPRSVAVETSAKVVVAPRIGLAYPVSGQTAVHFAFGHFYQFPPIGEIFSNADYSVLANLQAGISRFGVLGNPDVRPEKTVQYEIGVKHSPSRYIGIEFTTFYKDIRDLLGVEFISTYNDAEYARLANADFGNVFGFTLALDHRKLGPFNVSLDYTWQKATGNSSDPRETATRAAAGEDPRPRLVPFNWDQQHTFNATVSVNADVYSGSAILRAASGQPYTPVLEAGFGSGLDANSGRKPASLVLDLRAERAIGSWRGVGARFFGRAFNVFDTRFFNGAVYPSTGSPYYSRFSEADRVALADPTRFYAPRRLEVGVRFGSEVF
ncbi:TonB-dependent receptor [bacterium]|nr:TonB-dependent receptor [bacterium]